MTMSLNRWARLLLVGGIMAVASGCATHSLKDDVLDSNVVEFSKAQVCAEESQKVGRDLSAIECAKAYSAFTNAMGMVAYGSRVNIENVNSAEVSAHRANLELVERYGYLAATLGDAATTAKLKLSLSDEADSRTSVNKGTDARFAREMQTRQYEAQAAQYRKNDVGYTGIPDPVGDNISINNDGSLNNANTANGGQGGMGGTGTGGDVGDIKVDGSTATSTSDSSSTSHVDPITNQVTAHGGAGGLGGAGGNGGSVGDLTIDNASTSSSHIDPITVHGSTVGPITNSANAETGAIDVDANSSSHGGYHPVNVNANGYGGNQWQGQGQQQGQHQTTSTGGCQHGCEPDPSTPPNQWW